MSKNKLWLLLGALIITCGCLTIAGGGVVAYFFLQEQPDDISSEVAEDAPPQPEVISEDPDKTEPEEASPNISEEAVDSEPAPTSIPGWKKFEGDGVELWLPESFEGGNLDEDLEVIVDRLKQLGPDFENIAQMIEQNPSAFVLWAFDSEVGDAGFLTNVNATREQIFPSITMDTYLDAATKQLPPQFRVVDREIVSLDHYEAGRLFVDLTISGTEAKEVLYAIKDGDTMWIVVYATGADEFDERLPTFERSINTFVIQP